MKCKILLLLTVLFGLFLCGCAKQENTSVNVYKLTESLDDEAYSAYVDGDPVLFDKLNVFKNKLTASPDFDYYSYAENEAEVLYAVMPDECMLNYGTEFASESRYDIEGESATCVNAIQVSDNYFSLFPMDVSAGRAFDEKDCHYQNAEYIPVILGKKYQDTFAVGDTFEGYYILERRTFKVIGIAGDGAFYSSSQNCMIPYDNYIIMPFMYVEADSFAARAILLQQVSGCVAYQGDRNEALHIVKKYLKEAGLDDWDNSFGFLKNELPVSRQEME